MRVWIICFVVFFGAAEFYQWVAGLTLPLPVFIALGGVLAIASNSDKWGILPRTNQQVQSAPPEMSSKDAAQAPPISSKPSTVSFLISKRKSQSS
jgi:hypothetical protein